MAGRRRGHLDLAGRLDPPPGAGRGEAGDGAGDPALPPGPPGVDPPDHPPGRLGGVAYYPFGEEATDPAQTQQPLRFTGHERDLNAGGKPDDLDYMHARYYNSFLTRFLSTDPMDSAQTEIPQSWNKFAYTYNNPMRHIDPNGQTVVGHLGFSNQVGGITDLIGALQQYSDLVGPARAYPWQKDFHGTAFMAKQFSWGTSDFNALVGHSLGVYSALDSARRLEKVGIPVNILVTIDAAPGVLPRRFRQTSRLR